MKVKRFVFSVMVKIFMVLAICVKAESLYAVSEAALASEKDIAAYEVLGKATLPEGYAEDLLSQFHDEEEGLIWRNYILQKLDILYLHDDAAADRPEILSCLWRQSRSPVQTFAGTALLTLQRLHEAAPKVVNEDRLKRNAEWVASREAYTTSDRLSALHVLSDLDLHYSEVTLP